MRRLRHAAVIRNMRERLNETERTELLLLSSSQPPTGWKEYENTAVRLGRLAAKANGCRCTDDIVVQYRLVVENFRQASGGNLALLQDIRHESHQRHWKRNTLLARRLARQRKCHALKRGFVCYCDEHGHSKK